MKIKNVLAIAVLLIIAGVNSNLTAQTALRAMVKKCESIDSESVIMNVVRKKDKNTLKVISSIVTIDIPAKDKKLVNEFIEAFEKDEPFAFETIYAKKHGTTIPQHFNFSGVSFSFDYRDADSPDFFPKKVRSNEKIDESKTVVRITMVEKP